jgi:hypothetical protein
MYVTSTDNKGVIERREAERERDRGTRHGPKFLMHLVTSQNYNIIRNNIIKKENLVFKCTHSVYSVINK